MMMTHLPSTLRLLWLKILSRFSELQGYILGENYWFSIIKKNIVSYIN